MLKCCAREELILGTLMLECPFIASPCQQYWWVQSTAL